MQALKFSSSGEMWVEECPYHSPDTPVLVRPPQPEASPEPAAVGEERQQEGGTIAPFIPTPPPLPPILTIVSEEEEEEEEKVEEKVEKEEKKVRERDSSDRGCPIQCVCSAGGLTSGGTTAIAALPHNELWLIGFCWGYRPEVSCPSHF